MERAETIELVRFYVQLVDITYNKDFQIHCQQCKIDLLQRENEKQEEQIDRLEKRQRDENHKYTELYAKFRVCERDLEKMNMEKNELKESLKNSKAENDRLNYLTNIQTEKRKKLRSSYTVLKNHFNDDEDEEEVKNALNLLQEGLKGE